MYSKPNYIIAPSILSADFAHLGEEVKSVVEAGADFVHFDVMDNHYVPNLTFGPMICKALKPYAGHALMDVHLMVSPVDDLIHAFAKAGADILVFHPEATHHLDRSINLVKSYGLKVGLAFNPATPLNYLDYTLDQLDLVLLMSVNPGFGGQSFIPAILNKITQLRRVIDNSGREVILQVDGGIKIDNIAEAARHGATAFVAGSSVFNSPDYNATLLSMRQELSQVK